ncbi:MAG: class I SAM-dependent methyltransferase [Acidocella sp.]|nr:class I SAM-dependent methyltransferase [Acidocella sp.]
MEQIVAAAEIRKHLGELSDFAAVTALLPLTGLSVVDVGCGPGHVARELCGIGATVVCVEPDPVQAAKNRLATPVPGLSFIEARAEALPLETGTADGVFFFRSLHHVPIAQMDAALAEAARVLKPASGFLCVVEPAMTGSYFPVMRPYNDETKVRTQAQAALRRTAGRIFTDAEFFEYVQRPSYDSFASLVTRVTGQTFNNISRDRVETDEVRSLFEAGKVADNRYVFEQPLLLNLYRHPKHQIKPV